MYSTCEHIFPKQRVPQKVYCQYRRIASSAECVTIDFVTFDCLVGKDMQTRRDKQTEAGMHKQINYELL